MTWIRTISYEDAKGKLRKLYDRIKAPNGQIDQIMLAHSLRPHSMEGHMSLYKHALHHSGNQLPKWLLEALGVFVSHLNQCAYCFDHHFHGMKRLLKDDQRADSIREAILSEKLATAFSEPEVGLLDYAARLTKTPQAMEEQHVIRLRQLGWDDGAILEANQVVAYFAYANRTVLGLGVNSKGEVLGLSPREGDEHTWSHG